MYRWPRTVSESIITISNNTTSTNCLAESIFNFRRYYHYGITDITKRHDRSNEGKRQSPQRCYLFSCFKPELVDRVILKELKSVKEQVDTCPADRTDLKDEYQARYDIINEYAPKLLSAEEVKIILTERFADVLATKNKGQIMKAVMAELKGKADGKVINQVVAELCK